MSALNIVNTIIVGTFLAAAGVLIISQASNFATAAGAVSTGYTSAVKALSGR